MDPGWVGVTQVGSEEVLTFRWTPGERDEKGPTEGEDESKVEAMPNNRYDPSKERWHDLELAAFGLAIK